MQTDEFTNRNKFQRKNKSKFLEILKSKLFLSLVIVLSVFITLICIGFVVFYEKENDVTHSIDRWMDHLSPEQTVWFNSGLDELKLALTVKSNSKRAKNVILFLGDGMGPNTVTAARIYSQSEAGELTWEKFPHMGHLKTYCMDKQVPDSFSTASALFSGVKSNYETGGVDSSVLLDDCKGSLNETKWVSNILQWAQDAGLSTGFVTNTRVTHATPAALYTHCPNRRWECEDTMSAEIIRDGCKDIARQLIENSPGKNINVILGGGRQCLQSGATGTVTDPLDTWSCISKDGRDLISDWGNDKKSRGLHYGIANNTAELLAASTVDNVDYLLGIFANGHLPYDDERDKSSEGVPSLSEMTEAAIRVLSRNSKGFFLMVEGGLIDQSHHRGWAKRAISETVALEKSVDVAQRLLGHEADETLMIVTSDHSHTLSINGYPQKGSNIFGIAGNSKMDNIPYTTLTYATGGPEGFQYEIDKNSAEPKIVRRDPSLEDTNSYTYVQQTAILTDENTHGGVDVTIHAVGPMAHLFHKVHEQSYVAHVISYAARIGRFRDPNLVSDFLELIGIN